MKRSFFVVSALTVLAGFAVALPSGRTVVNPEGDPLVYVFISQDQLPEEFAERDTPPGAAEAAFLLREYQESMDVLPPGGMWRVPRDRGILTGYYVPDKDSVEAVGYPFVSMVLSSGTDAVIAVPATGSVVGSTTRLTERQVPELNEPVLLDGFSDDWADRELYRLPAMAEPRRVEIAASGREMPTGQSRHWRSNGTGILHIGQVMSPRYWYVSMNTAHEIDRNTFYYFRVFRGDRRETALGDVIVPVTGSSGPVLFRSVDGSLTGIGQYALGDSFIEWSILREYISLTGAEASTETLTADLAVGVGTGFEREIYTLTTLSVGKELAHFR